MTKSIRTIATAIALTFATFAGSSALAATPASIDQVEVNANEQLEFDSNDNNEGARFDAAVTLEGQVNINTASQSELELLPGIGPSIASRIVSYRKEHPFNQRNNIMRVKGIGQKTFAKIKDYLAVEGETSLRIAK